MILPFTGQKLYQVIHWAGDSKTGPVKTDKPSYEEAAWLDDADVVSSEGYDGNHMVILDIDVPAALIESTTPGHHHLYIDARTDPETYFRLLDALADAGVVERGYAEASKARGFSAVRLPWVAKRQET